MIIIFLINIKLSARFSSRDGEGGREGERGREGGERERKREGERERERTMSCLKHLFSKFYIYVFLFVGQTILRNLNEIRLVGY